MSGTSMALTVKVSPRVEVGTWTTVFVVRVVEARSAVVAGSGSAMFSPRVESVFKLMLIVRVMSMSMSMGMGVEFSTAMMTSKSKCIRVVMMMVTIRTMVASSTATTTTEPKSVHFGEFIISHTSHTLFPFMHLAFEALPMFHFKVVLIRRRMVMSKERMVL